MPLLRKKGSRIPTLSCLMADLHTSPRPGRALMVETGFPTSIVDLFVRNRDRLGKPFRFRRRTKQTRMSRVPAPMPEAAEDCTCELLRPEARAPAPSPELRSEDARSSGEGLHVSSVAMEVFVVVILALYTRRLVMGITVSALALLLLERVGVAVVAHDLLKFRRSQSTGRSGDVRNKPRYKRVPFVFDGTEDCHFAEDEAIADERPSTVALAVAVQ
ncbi:hypothetical protein SAY87_003433 [Trapa incisa]|uniref:Uncharacterized protein n=1 Tax=Trapa incisa TaxID=236973 RepID=A0AAN7KSJ0_9MYRT|nr:hypothetical protein SAY87_003433 [Trapa incisa]